MTLPTADWLAALADMDAAVAAALSGLDAYESRWPDPPPGPREATPLAQLEAKLAGWDERLVTAARLAEGLEREFVERAAVVGRWAGSFTGWWGRIQQPAESPA
jgi:hypothetical protein